MNRPSNKNSGPIPVKRPAYTAKGKSRGMNISPWGFMIIGVFLLACIFGAVLMAWNFSQPVYLTPTPESIPSPTESVTPLPVPSATATKVAAMPDIPSLQPLLLDLINQDRRAAGLEILEWDQAAATTAIIQSQEMARYGYLSYWNLDGQGPDLRFYTNGGSENVFESSYHKQISYDLIPLAAQDWETLVRNVYTEYANTPSFREAAMHPALTHAGIGLAYDPSTGWLTLTHDFIGKYISINLLPKAVTIGTEIDLVGKVEDSNIQSVAVELKYEAVPSPKDLAALSTDGDFVSAAETFQSFDLPVEQGQFSKKILMENAGKTGYYHICIWINTPKTGRFMTVNYIIQVVP